MLAAGGSHCHSCHLSALTLAALENAPFAACVLNGEGAIAIVNRAWRTLTASHPPLGGFAADGAQFVATCERAEGLTGSLQLAAETRRLLSSTQDTFTAQLSFGVSVGQRSLEVRGVRLEGDPAGYVILFEDVTANRQAELSLHQLRAVELTRSRQALQHSLLAQFGQFALENPPIVELTAQLIEVVKQGLDVDLCRLLETGPDDHTLVHTAGYGWDEACLRAMSFDVVAETEDRFVLGAREAIIVNDYTLELRFRPSPIQQIHAVRSAVEVLICGAGGTYGIVGAYAREPGRFDSASSNFLQNVSNTLAAFIERKATEDRLAFMAQFDSLTGLPNRSLYLDRLGHTLIEATRDRLPVAVLFVDVDRFKVVNDTLGHSAGDALLVAVAERLRASVRPGDTIGRLSGDEFAIALAHLAQDSDAAHVAQKVVRQMATPFSVGGHSVYVSASVGISMFPSDGSEADTLVENADAAMYRVKQGGRNNYQFYLPEMQVRASDRLRLETQLRGALDRGEFLLHYQPKIDVVSGAFSGLEALLRWQSPQRGLVPLGEFISVLEDAGLIIDVGEWVIGSVCAQIRRWQSDGIAVQPVAVNLSARQFRQLHLNEVIGRCIADSGIDPGLLEFELTESILMSDSESAVETLRQIKSRGIRLALDDFGTGYSSLSYLKRFPLDSLKIDRMFIRDVTVSPDDASIVLAIINLGRSLKLKVIAEGVETEAQLAFLRRHGCDEAQGYCIGRPMPVDAMTRILRNGATALREPKDCAQWFEARAPAR